MILVPHTVEIQEPQCGNFRIFLSLRFYVKSSVGECRKTKTAVFSIFGLWILKSWLITDFKKYKNDKNQNSEHLDMVDFSLIVSPKLISRKNLVIEKSWKLHTVRTSMYYLA